MVEYPRGLSLWLVDDHLLTVTSYDRENDSKFSGVSSYNVCMVPHS